MGSIFDGVQAAHLQRVAGQDACYDILQVDAKSSHPRKICDERNGYVSLVEQNGDRRAREIQQLVALLYKRRGTSTLGLYSTSVLAGTIYAFFFFLRMFQTVL